jgi:putative hemolysin
MLCNAFFSAAEVALISLKPVTMEELKKRGKRGKALGQLSSDTGRFLATVQIGVTLAGFLASAFASNAFSDPLAKWLDGVGGLSFESLDQMCVVVITIILSYFSLVFGELAPKQIALRFTSTIALNTAIPVYFLSRVTSPLVWLLNGSVNLIMKPFGPAKQTQKITEEEIRLLVNMGEKDGLLAPDERRIIQNVFDLDDITCGEIMTRRGVVSFIEAGDSPESVEKLLGDNNFSAYPVCRGGIDQVIGILYVADYFRFKLKNGRSPLPVAVMRKPHFVPEGATVLHVLRNMRRGEFEIAVVLDEFGGTAGIVTRDDLLEELVGSLHPQNPEELLVRISDSVWESGGLVRVAEVERELNWKLPEDDHRPDTIGGLLMAELDDIPKPCDAAEIGGMRLAVQAVDGRRIARIRIELLKPEQGGNGESGAAKA